LLPIGFESSWQQKYRINTVMKNSIFPLRLGTKHLSGSRNQKISLNDAEDIQYVDGKNKCVIGQLDFLFL